MLRWLTLVGALSLPVASARAVDVFLAVADSDFHSVEMFDPSDGTYLGPLLTQNDGLFRPINAVLGPDGAVYVSDQLFDTVNYYDLSGTLLGTFADASDGLSTPRGMDFRDNELFVASGDGYVARFDADGNRKADFFTGGAEPFDIYFLPDGSALVADVLNDRIDQYNADGTFAATIVTTSFPQQIQRLSNGNFVAASVGDDRVFEFDLSGNVLRSIAVANPRGVFELGNGRWLVTQSSAVVSIDPDTGDRDIVFVGGTGRFIELVPEPGTSMLLVIPGIICLSRRR